MDTWSPVWTTLRICSSRKRKVLHSMSEKNEKVLVFEEKFFSKCFHGNIESSFGNPVQVVHEKTDFFCSIYQQVSKNIQFSIEVFFFKLLLSTRRTQFRKPNLNASSSGSKVFHLRSENVRMIRKFSRQPFFFKMFLWKLWLEFRYTSQKKSDEWPKFFLSVSENG